jgi:serralysin
MPRQALPCRSASPWPGASGAATIGAHATLELAAADSASVTFAASTGMLKLDQPSTFSAEIFGFTGDGTLAGSDQIDLKGINYNTVQDSYANGVLTVTDGPDTVHLNFSGSYSLGNFKFASDGNGGTIVYDPPITDSAAPAAPQPASSPGGNNIVAAAPNAILVGDGAKDTFIFPANFGHTAIDNYVAGKDTIQFDHASFATADAAFAGAHDDGHGSVVMADAADDALTLHNITAAQLHHAHLLIV